MIYNRTAWEHGEMITPAKMNNLEQGVYDLSKKYNMLSNQVGPGVLFYDDFTGNKLNEDLWDYELGKVRNSEPQRYRKANVTVENSMLVITAWQDDSGEWTSGSIHTRGKFEQQYGKFEARIKFPKVAGVFPAFWTLGSGFSYIYSEDSQARFNGTEGWAYCGENDIVEHYPGDSNTLTSGGFYHSDIWSSEGWGVGRLYTDDFAVDEWHVYGCKWTENKMEYYIDDIKTGEFEIGDWNAHSFRNPHYMLLNLAIGAAGGEPNESTNGAKMYVDWVKVTDIDADSDSVGVLASKTVTDVNNYFHGRSYDSALYQLYNLINQMNNRLYYDNLVYSLPNPRTLYSDNCDYIDTGVKLFDPHDKPFSVLLRFSNSEWNNNGSDAHTILHCMDEEHWNGISLAVNNGRVQFDYTHSYITSETLFSDIRYNDEKGHTIILCKDNNKIRVYLDSIDNYKDIYPAYPLTEPLYKNLLVGCYEADGNKGRYWNGTIFDLKIWEECLSEYNINMLLS